MGPFTISTVDFGIGSIFSVEIGPGFAGNVKEVYITDILEHPHIFGLFKNSFGTQRYYCFDSNFQREPHHIKSGCGNSYVLASEPTETCDDGNNASSDGCSSSCQVESLYKCTPGGDWRKQ